MQIKPFGSKLIVLPKDRENHKSEGGIEVISPLKFCEVVEVSDEYSDIYSKGDLLLYEGEGKSELYNGQACFWIDGRPSNENGNVWAKVEK